MNTLKIFLMDSPELGVLVFILVAVLTTLICYGVTRILLISVTMSLLEVSTTILTAMIPTLFHHAVCFYDNYTEIPVVLGA